MSDLNAGVGRSDITPPIGIAHAGWGAQTHQRAESVDMQFFCTALVLAKGDLEIAIIDLDLIRLMPELDNAVREAVFSGAGIERSNIRISYSHTHAGPIVDFTWMTEGDELIPPFTGDLPEKVLQAVLKAQRDMQPVRVGAGRGVSNINVNRRAARSDGSLFCGRNWDGYVDREVLVIGLDDLDGCPVGTIVNYACHGTSIGPPNRSLAPDFPGPMRQTVERNVGGLCLFLQGATGNVGPVNGFSDNVEVYRKSGRQLGIEASRVRMDIDPLPRTETLVEIRPSGAELGIYEDIPVGEADSSLSIVNNDVNFPVREYPSVEQAQTDFDKQKANLVKARSTNDVEEVAAAAWPTRRAELNLHHAKLFGGGSVRIWLQAIRIGPAALLAVPLEPFCEIGAAIKKGSPAPFTAVSGYSNGYYGYMPIADAYPFGGYEVTTSPYGPDAADLLISSCSDTLDILWER